jgi:hypothetical protein
MSKTYKREVAGAMLAFGAVLFIWGVKEPLALEAAKFLTFPIFTFAAGAFAIDAIFKQGT